MSSVADVMDDLVSSVVAATAAEAASPSSVLPADTSPSGRAAGAGSPTPGGPSPAVPSPFCMALARGHCVAGCCSVGRSRFSASKLAASLEYQRELERARAAVDGRLASLFSASAEPSTPAVPVAGTANDWRTPVANALSSLFPSTDRPHVLVPCDEKSDIDAAPADPVRVVADALQLFAGLRERYGSYDLAGRVERTSVVCAWLTHTADALVELVRVQDALHVQAPVELESLPIVAAARIRAAEATAARRVEQVAAARRSADEARRRLDDERSAKERALQRCRELRELVDDYESDFAAAEHAIAAHQGCDDRIAELRAQVVELEDALLDAPGVTHLLSPAQAQHVFTFLWKHGFGQVSARRLSNACCA
ncbi:hypothetical protein P43SY_011431 [Pythium insidiosum]|uniref:Uncharacterized protein n=1 Tax=Pythium insidiosum TaxID=114742 RepID=A0AAD5LSD4_PYTIN|nr:hypothetical protein P43SY_011431 [Pythium insidiosum]